MRRLSIMVMETKGKPRESELHYINAHTETDWVNNIVYLNQIVHK